MGSNTSGFTNETELNNYINKTTYDSYNKNIKDFLSFVFGYNLAGKTITSQKTTGQQKPDLMLKCGSDIKYVSVKKGSGNSVHQEQLNLFTSFLTNMKVTNDTINNLKLFHYGDGTYNDTGKTRFSASECCEKYSEEIKKVNAELNKTHFLSQIIDRVLFVGNTENGNVVDIVYYGNVNKGIWASNSEIKKLFLEKSFTSKTIHFASLTYQVWGRNHNYDAKHPDRRYVMQVKWSQIVDDLSTIRKVTSI